MTSSAVPDPHRGSGLDVLACGLLFYDLSFGGLPTTGPRVGEEIWTASVGHGPGGVANFALTCSRLGLSTGIVACLGDDRFGELCRTDLTTAGIDMRWCVPQPDWSQPVTVALGYAGDRALITGGQPAPVSIDGLLIGQFPRARAAVVHLEAHPAEWLSRAAADGCDVYAEVGWDPAGRWDRRILGQLEHCHAFLPNEAEAQRYSGTEDVTEAVKRLAELTPLTVVTRGKEGAVAIDSARGEYAAVPSVDVPLVDPTGAGDAFAAALIFARLHIDRLDDQLRFATLVAGLTVARPVGLHRAPQLSDLLRWHNRVQDPAYAFLPEVLASLPETVHGRQTPADPRPGQPMLGP